VFEAYDDCFQVNQFSPGVGTVVGTVFRLPTEFGDGLGGQDMRAACLGTAHARTV
jgi:hypothetical protein